MQALVSRVSPTTGFRHAAAYCLGWYDEKTGVGEFEPVGTHPDHRRRGLATAVTIATAHARVHSFVPV